MMYHGRNVLEKPLVRAVVEEHGVLTLHLVPVHKPKLAPASGYQRSGAGYLYRVYDHSGQLTRVVNHDAAEPNVDWGWAIG